MSHPAPSDDSARAAPDEAALRRLALLPSVSLLRYPTPVEELFRLRAALGGGPRLLVKRDDAIPFAFGGNKARKLELVVADAVARGADTLVTAGALQSNHARATAAAAAKLGLRCHLVLNGARPGHATGNALLDELLGAHVEYVPTREARVPGMLAAMERLRRAGRIPFLVPLGASTPLGAAGYARAIGELLAQCPPPDVIVHATSSGGTQAGLLAGCALHALSTRVIGVSPDNPAHQVEAVVRAILVGLGELLATDGEALTSACPPVVDDGYIGDGYELPSAASREAQSLAARHEALFVDHTYTAKALAALIAYLRGGRFRPDETVLFWHTGGQIALFA